MPVLLCSFETWVPAKNHLSKVVATEMGLFQSVIGCTQGDGPYSQDNLKELNILISKVVFYKTNRGGLLIGTVYWMVGYLRKFDSISLF